MAKIAILLIALIFLGGIGYIGSDDYQEEINGPLSNGDNFIHGDWFCPLVCGQNK